ncbi:MAG: hypothetical protein ACM3JB_12840 [Acidobacteriaceae bacterium]
MSTHTIPIQGRGQVLSRASASIAVVGISASAFAAVGLVLSAALHIFAGVSAAPVFAEAWGANHFWLAMWNIVLPAGLLAITLVTYRSWREREGDPL